MSATGDHDNDRANCNSPFRNPRRLSRRLNCSFYADVGAVRACTVVVVMWALKIGVVCDPMVRSSSCCRTSAMLSLAFVQSLLPAQRPAIVSSLYVGNWSCPQRAYGEKAILQNCSGVARPLTDRTSGTPLNASKQPAPSARLARPKVSC